jgi:hypothetical protein
MTPAAQINRFTPRIVSFHDQPHAAAVIYSFACPCPIFPARFFRPDSSGPIVPARLFWPDSSGPILLARFFWPDSSGRR